MFPRTISVTCRDAGLRLGAIAFFSIVVIASSPSHAQNTCSATGVMAGENFAVSHCAAAVYPDQRSVTIWFNESPITKDETDNFQLSAYADSVSNGTQRTMLLVGFCPGGGESAAVADAVKSIDLGLNHAKSPLASAQWAIKAPRDFKIESMSGDIKPGGRLSGRITGSRSSDGRPYTWDLAFDVTLPMREAAAGLSCRK
ncbi:MAG: hypothetical protein ABIZ64_16680 [Casimicrobium sp.]